MSEMPKVKPIPKSVETYAHSLLPSKQSLYYKRFGKCATVTCAACGGTYTGLIERPIEIEKSLVKVIEKPEHNAEGMCDMCGRTGIYKARGRINKIYPTLGYFVMGQNLGEDFVFRAFRITRTSEVNQKDQEELEEYARIYLSRGKKSRQFWYLRDYYSGEFAWTEGNPGWYGQCHIDRSHYWPGTAKEIQKTPMLKYGDPSHWDPLYYYDAFARYPDFEIVQKAGMHGLMHALLAQTGANINPRGKTIEDRLRIYKSRLPELRKSKGDLKHLCVFQLERREKAHYTQEEIDERIWISQKYSKNDREAYSAVLQHTTLQKLLAYLDDQQENHKTYSFTYVDYIRMRQQAGYDLSNEIYLFPKDLRRRHDEMVNEINKKKNDEYKAKMMKKWPQIARKFEKLEKKFAFSKGRYMIRPAKDAAEIVEEGKTLHHCVGSSDTYFSKHARGESYILFLREKKAPDTPFATVEIRGSSIQQWYEAYDKKPDEKTIGPWLERYTEHLKRHKPAKNGTNQHKTA